MDSRSLQFFTQVYSAFEKKAEYEKELREYESKSGLSRLASRRPADPLQGFSMDELRELLPYSLECAVPELAFEHVSDDGSRVEASFRLIADEGGDSRLITRLNDHSRRLFNEEFFELVKGSFTGLPTMAMRAGGRRILITARRWPSRPGWSDWDSM